MSTAATFTLQSRKEKRTSSEACELWKSEMSATMFENGKLWRSEISFGDLIWFVQIYINWQHRLHFISAIKLLITQS